MWNWLWAVSYTHLDVYKRQTLEFAERLASLRKPVWLRYVLVPGVTDNLEEIEGLSRHAALLGLSLIHI